MLRTSGYRIMVASNGREGCSRAIIFKPDLILLDVRMPQMDGFSACRIIKANPTTAKIPVMFLSAASDVDDRLEGLRLGGVDYIPKPAVAEEVLLRVGVHLANVRAKARSGAKSRVVDGGAEQDTITDQLPEDTLLVAAIDLMEQDLSLTLQIDELAQKLGTNRRRLSDAFRTRYGCTVKNWLRERRMIAAKQWLTQTEMSILQISEELGYLSAGNFATAFRERFGVQPREYRAAQWRNPGAASDQDSTNESKTPTPRQDSKPADGEAD